MWFILLVPGFVGGSVPSSGFTSPVGPARRKPGTLVTGPTFAGTRADPVIREAEMTALLMPKAGADSTPDDIREALACLSAEAGRMLQRDGLGRVNAEWVNHHAAIDALLDALVGR